MNALKHLIGTGFYSGCMPVAPGTAGSLLALVPIYFLMQWSPLLGITLFILTASLLTLWVAPYFERTFGEDPAQLVMDEWAGQGLTFVALGSAYSAQSFIIILLSGFLLFRLFDVLKPLGIAKLQKLPAGWGILADDLLAGFYALICLKTLIFVWPAILEIG